MTGLPTPALVEITEADKLRLMMQEVVRRAVPVLRAETPDMPVSKIVAELTLWIYDAVEAGFGSQATPALQAGLLLAFEATHEEPMTLGQREKATAALKAISHGRRLSEGATPSLILPPGITLN